MIEIKGLSKSYEKNAPVLDGVNLTVPSGSVFGLVGINGAGKSTLLRLLSGVMKADEGSILIDGEGVFENEKLKEQIFFLPDEPFYSSGITADGLKEMYKAVYAFDEGVYCEYLKAFKLNPKKPIRNFSKGMKRQVFVSLALAVAPRYLFLDEAFDGLDPLARIIFKRGVSSLVTGKGTTVIISSHSLRELEDICDAYGIIDGRTVVKMDDFEKKQGGVRKYQAVFTREVFRSDLGFDCISFEKTGSVIRIVVNEENDGVIDKIKALNPLLVEEIPMDFEQVFIKEVTERGYLR